MTLLLQATIFLGAAIVLVPLGQRLGLAVVLGYLFTGMLLGPNILDLAGNTDSVMHLAEYGVVLFLFLIGLELQPSRLMALKRPILLLGSLQVFITGLIIMAVTWLVIGLSLATSFIVGFGLALSSTAFVLQLLTEKKQLNSTHGRKAFAILLFQDMAIIPILAILPLLTDNQKSIYTPVYFGMVLAVFLGLVLVSRLVMRPFFRFVAKSGAPELLTATALFILLIVSILMQKLQISMALGAFLTGVLLADSEYRHELEASIMPFKGLLLGLFFMSVGMSANLSYLLAHPAFIVACTLGLMILKFALVLLISKLYGSEWASSIRLGFALAQGGEFAFVLFNTAYQQQVLPLNITEPLMLIVTVSMALTPVMFFILDRWIEPRFKRIINKPIFDHIPEHNREIIIVGFGRIGQVIGRVLRMHNIEFTAIDHSIRQVDFVRKFGSQVYYGLPSSPALLRSAGIATARIFVLTLDDIEESVKTAEFVVRHYPQVTIFARARDRQHVYRLREIGVKHIWRETFPTAMIMSKSILSAMHVDAIYAQHSLELFEAYDEKLLEKQQAIFRDEQQLIASALTSASELESLFDSDLKKFDRSKKAQ